MCKIKPVKEGKRNVVPSPCMQGMTGFDYHLLKRSAHRDLAKLKGSYTCLPAITSGFKKLLEHDLKWLTSIVPYVIMPIKVCQKLAPYAKASSNKADYTRWGT